MANLDCASGTDDLTDLLDDGGAGGRLRAVFAERAWRAFLAALVVFLGFVVAGRPLFAISCSAGGDACQDGVRSALFIEAIMVVGRLLVPVVTLGTVVGLLLPRGGPRVGGIGAGLLGLLLIVMLILGQFPA